jgi:hypothetical protein
MAVDFDLFQEWCKEHFGAENIRIRHTAHGTEICAQSPWAEEKIGKSDRKYKLWMNPSGGKKDIEGGAYRCWYTDRMGSLVSLVSKLENIPYEEAEEQITGTTSLRSLEKKVHEFFGFQEEIAEPEIEEEPEDMAFPDFTFLIDKMSPNSPWRVKARRYLHKRKIPSQGLYVCTEDPEYGNRIIIPWYDRDERLYFWNARSMSPNPKVLRYTKPKQGDQENAIYMTAWPDPGHKVYIMEGEFDAISLSLANLVGCACGGKFLSDAQIELLRGHIPVLAFDADEAGREALIHIGTQLLEVGFPELYYVRPPKIYKDWNKLLVERNIYTLAAYIERFEKRFTQMTADYLLSTSL